MTYYIIHTYYVLQHKQSPNLCKHHNSDYYILVQCLTLQTTKKALYHLTPNIKHKKKTYNT